MLQFLWLVPLGFAASGFGTLIGAGGGFILVPVLLLLYPDQSPDTITSISMTMVFFNALSGSSAYARMKRIDYKSGLMFSAATIPGSVLGAFITAYIPRSIFNLIFGIIMVLTSVFLFFKKKNDREAVGDKPKHHVTRHMVDGGGNSYTFSFNPLVGIFLSIGVGFLSSLLGIGGGIIHVPALIHLLDFPVHIATATSQFILAITALSNTVTHLSMGTFSSGFVQTAALVLGALAGAQVGARLSGRIRGSWIVRSLAVGLGLAGIRILTMAF